MVLMPLRVRVRPRLVLREAVRARDVFVLARPLVRFRPVPRLPALVRERLPPRELLPRLVVRLLRVAATFRLRVDPPVRLRVLAAFRALAERAEAVRLRAALRAWREMAAVEPA